MAGRVEYIGNATLYLGDCLEVLRGLRDGCQNGDVSVEQGRGAGNDLKTRTFHVDAVITDPPFGVGNFVQITGDLRGDEVTWNESGPPQEWFDIIRSISTHRIIWGANFFNCFEKNGGAIVWDKVQPMPNFSKCDIASSSHLKKTEMVRIPWAGWSAKQVTMHPCERPPQLYQWCINYLPTADEVLDPYMGSGTCGVACMNLGRKFIGIEIEPKYFDISCERITNAQRQERLFA